MRHVQTPRPVHSLAEIALSLQVTRCPHCGRGPLAARSRSFVFDSQTGNISLATACRACGAGEELLFDAGHLDHSIADEGLRAFYADAILTSGAPVNVTEEPSSLIDVSGWLTLHSLLVNRARTEAVHARTRAEREAIRNLQILAGSCIDEALKFYDVDNDLPPEDGFFSDAGREQFRAHPELFLRDRLIDLRSHLPSRPTDTLYPLARWPASADHPHRWRWFWRGR